MTRLVATLTIVLLATTVTTAQSPGEWNRRVRSIVPQHTAGAPDSFFDIFVDWTIDLAGATSAPSELGVELELSINGVPLATQTHEDCVIWEISDAGGGQADCTVSADSCGTLVHNGESATAHIDSPFGTCSLSPMTAVFPAVELQPEDEIMVLLRPAPGTLPEPDDQDDVGILIFGSWNRRLVSVDVEPSAAGGPDTYDVSAEVVLEMHSGSSNVMLPLGIDTEPYAGDPCCEEACCCPPCSCTEEGCGGGGSFDSFFDIFIDAGEDRFIVDPVCDGTCDTTCGQVCQINNPEMMAMTCDPDDCICRSEPFVLTWEAIPVDPGGELVIILKPVPGALPELPGFPDDEETIPVPRICDDLSDCADLDDDGVRDNGCVWWECTDSVCVDTAIQFADMGGQFGTCPPDGTADNNDRNMAINCFANVDGDGVPGAFPCEPHPHYPGTAYNVDAGGQFGSCNPDGVCDGNDAFAALNAFAGSTSCSCAQAPAPAHPPAPLDVATAMLHVVPERATVRRGATVDVDVYLITALDDLRGYQLHAGVSGGLHGMLELVDAGIEAHSGRRQHTHRPLLAGLGAWKAFNVDTQQLLVGLDTPGVAVDPGYLGTFTYRVPKDARGEFIVDMLHDDDDRQQRTYLFPTPADGRIVVNTMPAVITVK